ncbi:VRR-NUC domain-containing protein [Staphylococcus kloosii]|uniref:VRR-NUC domain-containing protein n=1 Tax=Staphylococcus kloosii TaxID=29384 RepID=UPI0018A08749|nr:VRR-NUC domain-containing protein [Staphylococcus kloosii]MBF7029698.1 VRR-NUC domain-containing protein [Staphylococcus kloosii]
MPPHREVINIGPEKKVENKIRNFLESSGAFVMKTHGGSPGVPVGIPDLFAIYRGIAIFIEVKREKGGRVKPIQIAQIDNLKQHGAIAIIANGVSYVEDLIETIDTLITEGAWKNIQTAINMANEMGVKQ